MTEQKAIRILKEEMGWESDSGKIKAFAMGIEALEEIQQYRAIGTIEEVKQHKEIADNMNAVDMATLCVALSELKKYQSVGTVEECREAVEKQRAKKPNIWGDGYSNGEMVYDMYDCPNCGKSYELEYQEYDRCPNCGQAIDWGEEE